MKKVLILACLLAVATGCASDVKKHFTVVVDPPDARITVIPGGDRGELKYKSPADITVFLPKDPAEAAKGKLVVERDAYKPLSIFLKSIHSDTVRLTLEKAFHYRLKFRMVSPRPSEYLTVREPLEDLTFRDKILAVRLVPGERQFQLEIVNFAHKPLDLLWEKSDFTDHEGRRHRIVQSKVKPQDRLKPIPAQTIPAKGRLTEEFISADGFAYSQGRQVYELKPLFPVDVDNPLALKGKSFTVFLHIEMDGGVIPDYNFRIQIVDVIRE